MHTGCWERVTLICPRCRADQGLVLEQVFDTQDDFILEGFLRCPAVTCQAQYPILDSIPIVLKDMPRWWQHSSLTGTVGSTTPLRDYFAALDTTDPNRHERSRLLSTYMEAHYGIGQPAEPILPVPQAADYWEQLIPLCAAGQPYQYALDLGCSVGRYTFELARHSELAIGLDMQFDLLAAAARVQRDQQVCYQRAIRGQIFTPVEFSYAAPQNVFFLLADALNPPLQAASFDCIAALNLLDNVEVPLILIGQMDALLRRGGRLILSSPYEWRSELSEPIEWLENDEQDAATLVRAILCENRLPQMQLAYKLVQEQAGIPWVLRQHERAWRLFLVHLLTAQKG